MSEAAMPEVSIIQSFQYKNCLICSSSLIDAHLPVFTDMKSQTAI